MGVVALVVQEVPEIYLLRVLDQEAPQVWEPVLGAAVVAGVEWSQI